MCRRATRHAIVSGVKAARKREARKSARAKLAGAIPVTLRLSPHHQMQARLHELSVTGGVVHLEDAVAEGTTLMLIFETPAGLVKETAEMLAPHWATKGCLQPFRFNDPATRSQHRLQLTLRGLLEKNS